MKFTVLVLLLLAVTLILAKHHHSKKREEAEAEDEEAGDEEGGDEGEAGNDAGISQDTLMEYRILGAGTFSVRNSEFNEDGVAELQDDWTQFPNYCKQQLNEFEFLALTAKASVWLDCWYDATGVESLDECSDAMALCAEDLSAFELNAGEEGGDDEEEGDDEEGDEDEGDEEEDAEEDGDEEEGDEEEGDEEEEAECEEGDEDCEAEETETEEDEEDQDDEEQLFIHEDVPQLDAVQAACFYQTIAANLTPELGRLTSDDVSEDQIDGIFAALTFQQLQRTSVSWLEFWLYMCNKKEDVAQDEFDTNPLLIHSHEAVELYEKLNPPVSDDEEGDEAEDAEEEEAEERKVVKKSAKKAVKKASKLVKQ